MNKKEEAIKRCNELIKVEHANWIGISNQMAIGTVLNYIEELEKEKQQVLDDYQELGKDLHDNFIPKQVILDKIEELEKYRDLAKEQIEEKIIIADSDSLNYGRAEAHNKDISVLQEILNKGEKDE